MTPLRLACILLVALGSVAGCSTSGGVVSDGPPQVGDWYKFSSSSIVYEIVVIRECGVRGSSPGVLCAWLQVVGGRQTDVRDPVTNQPFSSFRTLATLVEYGRRVAN